MRHRATYAPPSRWSGLLVGNRTDSRVLFRQHYCRGILSLGGTGVVLNQGDSRTVANIHLKVGAATAAVTVVSGADAEVPVDTAEVSAQLNNELVDTSILTGRNAAELVKLMPGVTFNNGGGAGNSFGNNGIATGTNNGPAGTFSANGTQPTVPPLSCSTAQCSSIQATPVRRSQTSTRI